MNERGLTLLCYWPRKEREVGSIPKSSGGMGRAEMDGREWIGLGVENEDERGLADIEKEV